MRSPRPHSDLQNWNVLMTGTQLTLEKFCSKIAVLLSLRSQPLWLPVTSRRKAAGSLDEDRSPAVLSNFTSDSPLLMCGSEMPISHFVPSLPLPRKLPSAPALPALKTLPACPTAPLLPLSHHSVYPQPIIGPLAQRRGYVRFDSEPPALSMPGTQQGSPENLHNEWGG